MTSPHPAPAPPALRQRVSLLWGLLLLAWLPGAALAQPAPGGAPSPAQRADALRAQANREVFRAQELRAALQDPAPELRRAASDVLRSWRGRRDCDPAVWAEIVRSAALAKGPPEERLQAYLLLSDSEGPYPPALVERLRADLCSQDLPAEVPHAAGRALLFAPTQAQRAAGFRAHVEAFAASPAARRSRFVASLADRDHLFDDYAVVDALAPQILAGETWPEQLADVPSQDPPARALPFLGEVCLSTTRSHGVRFRAVELLSQAGPAGAPYLFAAATEDSDLGRSAREGLDQIARAGGAQRQVGALGALLAGHPVPALGGAMLLIVWLGVVGLSARFLALPWAGAGGSAVAGLLAGLVLWGACAGPWLAPYLPLPPALLGCLTGLGVLAAGALVARLAQRRDAAPAGGTDTGEQAKGG